MVTELPVALSERVEFASGGWIAQMQHFCESRRELRAAMRAPFSFSARYTNPPGHLDHADDACGYCVTLDSDSVTATSKPNENANYFVEQDYNAALPLAWTIHGGDDHGFERIGREYAHIAQSHPPRERGKIPDDPAVTQILLDLHDHMAQRTPNNPDIQQRAAALGLERQVAELDELGYTILRDAFTDEYADEFRQASHENVIETAYASGEAIRRGMMNLHRGRMWEEAIVHPWVLTLAEHLLGRGCLVYQSSTIVKTTGQDAHPGLHSDYGASMVPPPYPDFCLEATAVWAIDDFREECGPTVVLPGSFKKGRPPPPGTTQEGTTTLAMDKGSIGFWHGASWHGAMPRTAQGERTSLHNAYSRGFFRPLERYEDIDKSILDRNPPAFSTLCGLDDALGKSSVEKTDFERLAYASQHGYGNSEPIPNSG